MMHEHHFIQNILKDIPKKEDVIAIEIELGELVGIDSLHLKEHLIDETGWNVKVIVVSGKIKCPCGYEGIPKIRERLHDMVIYECPECGYTHPEVIEGDKITIKKITYK